MRKIFAISMVALALVGCEKSSDDDLTNENEIVAIVEQLRATSQPKQEKRVPDEATQNYVDELYTKAGDNMKDILSVIAQSDSELSSTQKNNAKQVAINELQRDTESGEWSAVVDFLDSEESVKVPANSLDSFLINGVAYKIIKSEGGQFYAIQQGTN